MNTLRTIGLLCVTLRYVSSKATAARIHCQAPSVFPGDPANLTCFFPEDLRQTRTGFCVFQLNPPDMHEECVLGCSWENGQPVCVGEGFHLVSIVSNEVTFEIPSHKPGMFFCDTLPSDRKDTGLYCNFTLKDALRTSPRTPPPSSTGPTITTERREDDGDAPRTSPRTPPPSMTGLKNTTERREDGGGHLVVVIICLSAVMLIIIITIILCHRRKLKALLHCRRKKSNPTSDKEAAQDERIERPLLSTDEVNSEVDKGDKGKLDQVAMVSKIQPLLSTDEVNSEVDKGDKGKLDQTAIVFEKQPLLSTDEVNSEVDKGDKAKLDQVAMVSKIQSLLQTHEAKADKGDEDQVELVSEKQMTTYDRTDDAFTPKGHPHRRQKDDDGETVRLLWVGKIGREKSTTGSTFLGQNVFHTAADSNSVTGECVRRVVQLGDTRFEIMDAPGLQDVHKPDEEIRTIVAQSLVGMHPGPHAVLFFIEGARFVAKYYDAYRRLKALFDDSISNYTILVFTDGEELERRQIVLSPNNHVLQSMLQDCENRYLFFNDKAANPQLEMKLLTEVRRQVAGNRDTHYSCNKYSRIVEKLEEEINRSQVEFDKEDRRRQTIIQTLQKTILREQKIFKELMESEVLRAQETI